MAEPINLARTELLDLSIDELFTQYSVSQIQRVHKDYRHDVSKAKNDLHALVGEKYRDLIRIAEDINSMSTMSSTIDGQITDLSYRPSRHVLFGSNNFRKFESMIRNENATKARQASQKTILNAVINNRLIGYDLKLQADGLSSTASLEYMAKVYYTVSSTFKETLEANPYVSANFLHLRSNFIAYLEGKMASHLPKDASGKTITQLLFNDSATQWVENDNVDFLTDDLEEDDLEDSQDDEDTTNTRSFYGRSTTPIVNYLLAYVIVHHDDSNNSLEGIAQKFIKMRHSYLELIIEDELSSGTHQTNNFNFTAILKFIELTCQYASDIYLTDGRNSLLSLLKRLKSWDSSDQIGFHNWFENEQVHFNSNDYANFSQSSVEVVRNELSKFADLLLKLLKRILKVPSGGNEFDDANLKLYVFHNFVTALRKLEVVSNTSSSNCHTTKLVSDCNLVTDVLDFIVESIQNDVVSHQNILTLTLSIQISSDLRNGLFTGRGTHGLFSVDLVDMIDTSVEKYFETVLKVSTQNDPILRKGNEDDTCSLLKSWFYVQSELLRVVTLSDDNVIRKVANAVTKKYGDLDMNFSPWGSFDEQSFVAAFETVSALISTSLGHALEAFIENLSGVVEESIAQEQSDVSYYLLRLLLTLKTNLSIVKESTLQAKMKTSIENSVAKIYERIFSGLLDFVTENGRSFKEILSDVRILSNSDDTAIPIRPQLVLYSGLNRLASQLLNSSTFKAHEIHTTYVDKHVKSIFVEKKNDWIIREVLPLVSEAAASSVIGAHSHNGQGSAKNTEIGLADALEPNVEHVNVESEVLPDSHGSIPEELIEDIGENGTAAAEELPIGTGATNSSDPEVNDEQVQEADPWADDVEDDWHEDEEPTLGAAENVPAEEASSEQSVIVAANNDAESSPIATDSTTERGEIDEVVDEDTSSQQSLQQNGSTNGDATDYKILVAQSRQSLANIVFVLNLTTASSVLKSNPDLAACITRLNASSESEIEESTVDIILRATNDFYKTSKEMYLPLLLV